MKNLRNVVFGIILIALGMIFGLNVLGYTQIDIFFDGWWTLFIIVPCLLGLLRGKDVRGNLVGISIGAVLLLICQDVLSLALVSKLIFPALLVIFGVCLIFKDAFGGKAAKRIKELNFKYPLKNGTYATFSSQSISFSGQEFMGTELTAAFGKITCDLSSAIILGDCVINANATFGSIEINLPQNVNIVVRSNSLFGGVSRQRSFNPIPAAPTIFINASCLFGGVDLK